MLFNWIQKSKNQSFLVNSASINPGPDFAFENDLVTKWRFVVNDERNAWKGVSTQTQAKLQKCNKDYGGFIIVVHGGLQGVVRDPPLNCS